MKTCCISPPSPREGASRSKGHSLQTESQRAPTRAPCGFRGRGFRLHRWEKVDLSYACLSWAVEAAATHPELTTHDWAVLIHLANRANRNTGNAFPSRAGIVADIPGISRAQVTRCLKHLRELGLIVPVGKGGKSKQAVVYKIPCRYQQQADKSYRWERYSFKAAKWAQGEPTWWPTRLTVSPHQAQAEPSTRLTVSHTTSNTTDKETSVRGSRPMGERLPPRTQETDRAAREAFAALKSARQEVRL